MTTPFAVRKQFGRFECMLGDDAVEYLAYLLNECEPQLGQPLLLVWLEEIPSSLMQNFEQFLSNRIFFEQNSNRLLEQLELEQDVVVALRCNGPISSAFVDDIQLHARESLAVFRYASAIGISLVATYNALCSAAEGEQCLDNELSGLLHPTQPVSVISMVTQA